MTKFNTVQECFEVLGLDPLHMPEVSMLPEKDRQPLIDYYRLTKVIEAHNKANEDWVADWKDSSQWKYYPWFDMSSGSGLAYHDYGYSDTYTGVGSRLCLPNAELTEHVGTTFIDLYKSCYVIINS